MRLCELVGELVLLGRDEREELSDCAVRAVGRAAMREAECECRQCDCHCEHDE